MLKNEVVVGRTYLMNHTSGLIPVKILRERTTHHYQGSYADDRTMIHFVGLNLKTGREIKLKGAGKLRRELLPDEIVKYTG